MDEADRRLLDRIQAGFPLVPRPFAALGEELGLSEVEVVERVGALQRAGVIRRIGPVVDPRKAGRVGVLAAMAVPERRLEAVAAAVSALDSVTHNYRREARHGTCPYNLWFTVGAGSEEALHRTVAGIEEATGLAVATFPARRVFKIGVQFGFADGSVDG
jgi:DNA-binding Lrp family transcriptional regulator